MPATPEPDPRRWTALFFIALGQLMIVLDVTVVNIAMPSAQFDLGMSDGDRQWIITAYTLAFGGLLLAGGRVADLVGRKRTFVVGLLGFAVASALGGAAVNGEMLIAARALQGVFGALIAPSALALVTVTFTEATERAKAFGIYSAIAGSGGAIGLILGGVLTEYLNWRWALYLSIPVALVAGAGALAVVPERAEARGRDRLDLPGVLLVTMGLVLLVSAFARAESDGWTAGSTVGGFVAAAVLLAAFIVVEGRVKAPLLPLRVVVDRNRGGVYLALLLAVISLFGLYLFLTYYLQVVKGFSPVLTGLAFLPMVVALVIGSTQIAGRLPRVAPRLLMSWGFGVAALGMLLLTRLQVDSGYTTLVLPVEILVGLGMGTAMVPAMSLATMGIEPHDTGVASAMVTAVQQVGGAIGTVMLNTIAAGSTTAYVSAHLSSAASTSEQAHALELQGMVHGFASATWWTVGVLILATVITAFLVDGAATASGSASEPDSEPRSQAEPETSKAGLVS